MTLLHKGTSPLVHIALPLRLYKFNVKWAERGTWYHNTVPGASTLG